jgi:hypothetical protein
MFTQRVIKNRLRRAASNEPGVEFCWCYKQHAGIDHGLYKANDGCPSCFTQLPHFRNLVTAKQAVWVYGFAGVTKERLPKGNDAVVFPSPIQEGVSFAIRKTSEPAVYGGKLYEVLHYAETFSTTQAERNRQQELN